MDVPIGDGLIPTTGGWLSFFIGALATWRLTHLLAHEDGPADVIVSIRRWLGQRWVGRLMDCFNCMSVWVAMPIAFFVATGVLNVIMSWLALSGAACLLQRLGREPVLIHPVEQTPVGIEAANELLQREESRPDKPT